MTYLATPKNYTQAQFKAFVDDLVWTNWKPKFITLHNTASPTLSQWGDTEGKRLQRVENLNAMYKNVDHWHSAVHLFCDQYEDGIWNACSLTQDGVSVSCWNTVTLGIEMVGNYALESENTYKNAPAIDDWNSAAAKVVYDNAVFAMAVLHKKLNLDPGLYQENTSGLHMHRECTRDGHLCPGGQVNKAKVVQDVIAKMNSF
jgi:hypothetical protein